MRKSAPASPKGSEAAGKARNSEKRAFHSPIFRITCIIRNDINFKNRGPLLLPSSDDAGFGGL